MSFLIELLFFGGLFDICTKIQASLCLKPSSAMVALPLLSFQTVELSIGNILRNSEIRWDTGSGSVEWEPNQIRWNCMISDSLFGFIPKLMGFSQQIDGLDRWWYHMAKTKYQPIVIYRCNCDFAILQICCAIHNNLLGLIFTTLFTISVIWGSQNYCRYYKGYHRSEK